MPLIPSGPNYRAMRMLTPRVFAVAVESPQALTLFGHWRGEGNVANEVAGGQSMAWGMTSIPDYPAGYEGNCFHVRYVSSTGIPHLVYIPTLVDFDYTKPWFLEWHCKTDLKPAAFIYVSHACCTVSIEYGKVSLYFPLLGWVSQDYNSLAANQWYKFRLSYDGINKWDLYVDDVLQVPNEYQNYSYDAQGEPENIQFWANTDGFSDHEALVDEVKIYGFST